MKLLDPRLARYIPFAHVSYMLGRSQVLVVPELRLAFVAIPRAANSSMKAAIVQRIGLARFGAVKRCRTSRRKLNGLTDYFRFGFVRNPLDRLLSCYSHKVVEAAAYYGHLPIFSRYGDRFTPGMSFDAFVRAVARTPDRFAEPHFRSQHTSLYWRDTRVVDFVGRFERLDDDWNEIRRRTGLDALPHHNRSAHGKYREQFSRELARLAARRYERDIELFGYTDEIADLLE